ncbi:hypothetical protein [Agrobacterium sp. OT33]|uniref:hypothetical protein n=1 Tax=Agrobacterium sp. OT33 TaxID=2815338 RepID=UPI001A903B16|nr:hypothetical protein [Agrobacterium sp. OT33]MBO0125109.1 hypothetical protein [Agrobacterium sp. OT33]
MDIAGSIAAVTAALGLVKELREIDAQYDKAEMKLKIAELTEALSDTKQGVADVAQALKEKDEEIDRLKKALQRREITVERRGYRYRQNANGDPVGDPFCPICLEEGNFTLTAPSYEVGKPFKCPRCKANFGRLTSYRYTE